MIYNDAECRRVAQAFMDNIGQVNMPEEVKPFCDSIGMTVEQVAFYSYEAVKRGYITSGDCQDEDEMEDEE